MIGIHVSLWTPSWEAPFLDHIRKAADMGFDAVEIPIMDPDTFPLDTVRKVLDETGLAVFCGTGLGPATNIASEEASIRRDGEEHLRGCLDIATAVGSPSLQGVIHSAWGWQEPVTEVHRRASAGVLRRVADEAGERGMILSMECINRYESSFLNTVKQGIYMLELIGRDNVGLHLDTYHMHIEEDDLAGALTAAGKKLFHLHLSENQRGFPGSGQIDFPAVVSAAKGVGYSGPWIIESYVFPEFATGADVSIWRQIEAEPERSLRDSLKVLRAIIA